MKGGVLFAPRSESVLLVIPRSVAKLSDAGSVRTAHSRVLYLRCFAVLSYATAFAVLGPVSGNAATRSFPRLLERRRSNLCNAARDRTKQAVIKVAREQ